VPGGKPAATSQTTAASGGGSEIARTYRLGGKIPGWQGLAPGSIKGTENPTLTFVPGKTYKVSWKNLDGAPHNFTVLDSQGNHLVHTKTVSKKGAVTTVTFTASKKMARYLCTIHPTTMHGQIKLQSPGGGGATAAGGGGAANVGGGGGSGGGGGQQGLPIPHLATMVSMVWTAAMTMVVGLAIIVLREFDEQEP
ncbi:MAG: plastocyanin/azurin family copper-binding protein, partial [Salinigranum sp.]